MQKIQASLILEILGRPKDNVTTALNELVKKISLENGIKILEKNVHEPVQVKETEDLYTSFADILVELDSLEHYFGILFAYMPSNFVIISPEKVNVTNINFNDLAHKLISRLHDYDAITKKALIDNEALLKKLQEVAPNLFQQTHETNKKIDKFIKGKTKRNKKAK